MMRFLFLLLLLLPHTARAADLDYNDFAALPVQHEGRIKPMDTFARAMLEHFSGHESVDRLSADEWMAETLFDPAQALHRPVFRIFRPDSLNLPAKDSRYYSYADLAPALQAKGAIIAKLAQTDEKDWSEDQRELMRLSESALLYTQLLRSFSFVLPLNVTLPPELAKEWKIKGEVFTLQDYRKYEPRLKKKIQDIIRKKGEDPARYSEEEKAAAQLAMDLQILEQAGQDNILLRIVRGINGEEWFSPWALTEQGQGSPQSVEYLKHWEDMARGFQASDAQGWKAATKEARNAAPSPKLDLEILYNKIHPLLLAGIAYLLAFIGIVVYSLRGNNILRIGAFATLGTGALLHLGAITARVYILDRAPVGTLYESIVFVSLVCVLVALVLEKIKKDGQGVLIGALAGPILLFVAGSFADGDTMKMLVAVLNTNFWLSTHVLCITMGYGWCVVASLLAHTWLVRAALGKTGGNLVTSAKIVALIALLFTAIGTILGGIWADQSWGRFWGWDPKENGALLIVLWLIWVIHGQLGGQLNRASFMAGIAALSIVVALAWFGVNLLSVGLHSYGFITGVAAGLGAFCTAEMLLIGFLWHRTGRAA
jgi:ABC-type transport system involved in cytochrome c biogenesis permease subunit